MTPEDEERLIDALRDTWAAIAMDYLAAYELEYPDFPGVDAGEARTAAAEHLDVYHPEEAAVFRSLDHANREDILSEAFSAYSLYGR